MNNQISTNHSDMSNEKFLGVFDADGSVLINIVKSRALNSTDFKLHILYEVNQAISRKDLVEKVAEKFEGQVTDNGSKATFKVPYTTESGKKVRNFLNQNQPLCPSRLHDYLLSEEVIKFQENLGAQTKADSVCLITLAYNNKRNLASLARSITLKEWIDIINPSDDELKIGTAMAETLLKQITNQVKMHEKALPTMSLPLDYIRGSHIGDGTLMVSLSWKPSKTYHRRRIEPIWAIVNQSEAYCEAFAHTLNFGDVRMTGPNLYQFVIGGERSCSRFLYVFENTWLPAYKLDQYQRFREVLRMLQAKEHFTIDGTVKIVDLVYGIAEKGGRKASRDQLIDWGITWLRDKGYIKPDD